MVTPMSLFTSDRERRLWFSALAVRVAIYSTLGLARTLVDALREENLLRVSFALVVLLVIGAIPSITRYSNWGNFAKPYNNSEYGNISLSKELASFWLFRPFGGLKTRPFPHYQG